MFIVYPVASDSLPGPHLSSQGVLAREYERALKELREYADDFRELDEVELEKERDWLATLADGSTLTGHSARLMMRWGGIRVESYLLVFVRDGTFIKFRFSCDTTATDKVLPRFERAVQELLAAVGRQRE
jgi:hypothetical protein